MTRARELSRFTNENVFSVEAGTFNVGIGSTTPDVKLDVSGSIEATGISTFQNNLFVGAGITMLASSGIVSAVAFYGDGSNLDNTGSTLSAASGSQRVVVTSLTSGTMTSNATDADLTFDAGTNTLNVGGGANISGVTTSGTAIVGSAVTINATGVNATGVITATSFEGDGTSLTGVTPFNWSTKTGNYTAVHKDGLFVDTSAGIVTVTLPASPSAGDYVHFIDLDGTFATNNLIINRNGSNIIGVASDMTVDINNSGLTLVYTDATNGWKLLNF